MFSKRKNITITLKIATLQCQKKDTGEFQVKWERRSEKGETKQHKLDSDNIIYFNETFPINANFIILKNGEWREKIVDIELIHYTIFKKNTVNSWKMNLADLRNSVTITKELKYNTEEFGLVSLIITLFKGLPSEMPAAPLAKFPMMHSASGGPQTISMTPPLKKNINIASLERSPSHGLGTLRRNSFNSPRPVSMMFTSPVPATQSSFSIEVSDECQKLKNDEYDCMTPDIPEFGERIAYMFLSQQRGTNYESAISCTVKALEEKAFSDFETARYCFLSMAYLYSLLRANGLPTRAATCNMADSVTKLFNLTVNMATQQLGGILQKPDPNGAEMIYAVFDHNQKLKFSNFLNSLIIFCVAVKANPVVGREIINKFEIQNQRFFDASILNKPENEPLMSIPDAYRYANACLFDCPTPPLPKK